MGYTLPALTCVKASERAKAGAYSIRPVGQRRAYILTTAASEQAATEEAIIELAAQPEVVRLVDVVLTLTATFRRRKSDALLLLSYALPQN